MRSVDLLVITIAVLFFMSTAHATIWYVHPDSALNSIQAGIDSCSTGDSVLVGPGTYIENINFNGMAITVTSEYGPDTTIIDGGNPVNSDSASVVLFISGEDTSSVLDRFTLTNGSGTQDPTFGFCGGGIYCRYNSSPTIIGNTITGNSAEWAGGIFCWVNSSPKVTGNTITDNAVDSVAGGIGCWENSSPIITGNTITGNTAGKDAGGITCSMFSSPTIIGNNITYNTASGGGGGIECWLQSDPTIINNTITDNTAGQGGGIICWFGCLPTIESCAISNNTGDGIYCLNVGNPVIRYNDIIDNIGYAIRNTDPGVTVNADSNWWGDATGPYHPTANPGGLGDTVSDYVDFDPWLTGPGVGEQPVTNPVEKHENLTAIIFSGPLHLPEREECKVFDITGRVVEPSRIQPGIYFIEVDGVVTQKVVKVR
jgi:parallel beta-helix repeat protein